MKYKIALIGCGVVGTGFLEILNKKKKLLKEKFDFEAELVAVSDMIKGSVIDSKGIDIGAFLKHLDEKKSINEFSGQENGLNAVDTIQKAQADMVMEVTYTDIETGEPASTHIREAFKAGSWVSTTNKGPVTLFEKELTKMAEENGVGWRYEGVVLSGTPVFNLLDFCLAGNDIKEIKGIMNGTTNFILTKMEEDAMAYDDALKLAQDLGYAEADPTADVEGFDALAKIVIMSNVVLGGNIKPDDAEREGISKITPQDIMNAKKEGKRYKLIASAKKENGKIKASVKPMKIPLTDPLAGVGGAMNALTVMTDLSGPITVQGPGAGKIETGYALLIDALAIHREISCKK